ncbi:MAG: hypothetical protein LQ343_000450 [Gyalolechia ehrenbergii]|nr:MAG: hypothetical protein LQ343_000450 [Gyalolechia ehrenbergii]
MSPSSNLQRAVKTAEALLAAQPMGLIVQQLPVLREQDFGFYEGKPFYARQRDANKSGKDAHRLHHQNDPSFEDVESKESMAKRTNAFLAENLLPLISEDHPGQEVVVAIVSHGMILSQLWKSILGIFSKQTVALAPDLSVGNGGVTSLERLGGWSNTGYLELDIKTTAPNAGAEAKDGVTQSEAGTSATEKIKETLPIPLPPSVHMLIKTVNGKEHLKGLKRARGVGSSQYDEGQRKIESFFKKSKAG